MRTIRLPKIVSDDSWKASTGAILYSEIYDGELCDARKEKPGWSSPGYTESGDWSAVRELPFPTATLVSPTGLTNPLHRDTSPHKSLDNPIW